MKIKTQTIWNKFILKSLNNNLIEEGYLVVVHPSGWRNVEGKFKKVQNELKSRQILTLQIHCEKDGLKTFGVETRYDFYCLKNIKQTMFTKIIFQDKTIERVDISKLEFIPNGMFIEIQNLLAIDGEEKVNILNNSSYHTHRPHMLKEQTDEFKYPCVYLVKKGDKLSLKFSNTNQKGHFGIPKLIWSNGRIISVGSFIDEKGEYGLTQFAYAIVDEPKNLFFIKRAFDNPNFRELMKNCSVSDMSINRKIIALFRKNFWEEFI